jgi:DMSO/TMAO reductase YedYZ heme-binding membrane subunit
LMNVFLERASMFGEIAVLLYVLTLLPGIARRFRWKYKGVSILMIYRRYIGILAAVCVLLHGWFERGIDWLLRGQFHGPIMLFEFFGLIAGCIFLILGITSNDVSTKKMGVWWGRIHTLTYVLVWGIFFHIAFVETSEWAVLLGLTGLLVIISHLYSRYQIR